MLTVISSMAAAVEAVASDVFWLPLLILAVSSVNCCDAPAKVVDA